MERHNIKSQSMIRSPLKPNTLIFTQSKISLAKPNYNFASPYIKTHCHYQSRPLSSRTKIIETTQNFSILCPRCKKLKPNTFLKESLLLSSKICDCLNQIHTQKIKKLKEKNNKSRLEICEKAPFYAQGKNIFASSQRIRRFISEVKGSTNMSLV